MSINNKPLVTGDNLVSDEELDLIGSFKQFYCKRIIELLDDLEGLSMKEFEELKDFLNKVERSEI